jgi:glycolate oxidase FAD binding subunit
MQTISELIERVRAASASRTPLLIHGGGSKDFYGNPTSGERLDTRGLHGIVEYEPTELVVTVLSGTPLAELEAALDQRGQMLAFEPPRFAPGGTVGGMVAAGLSGPRRAAFGPFGGGLRDFILGASLIDGRGNLLRFGGTVMKNVAGYDMARALAGSLGILGVLVDASIKVLPRPAAERTLRLALEHEHALRMMNEWAALPLPISATAWNDGVLHVRLSGAQAAVQAASALLGGDVLDPTHALAWWEGLRDQRIGFFRGGDPVTQPLWRLSLPSTAPMLSTAGDQLIEWSGALRWLRSSEPPARVRQLAAQHGGHATLFRGGDRAAREAGAFTPLTPPLAAIHQRLKAQFDPTGIFNRGRMYPQW